jgi:hypothetical protein
MVFVRQRFITYLPDDRRRRPEVGIGRLRGITYSQNLAEALKKE